MKSSNFDLDHTFQRGVATIFNNFLFSQFRTYKGQFRKIFPLPFFR